MSVIVRDVELAEVEEVLDERYPDKSFMYDFTEGPRDVIIESSDLDDSEILEVMELQGYECEIGV